MTQMGKHKMTEMYAEEFSHTAKRPKTELSVRYKTELSLDKIIICQWSPKRNFLASGSNNAKALVTNMGDNVIPSTIEQNTMVHKSPVRVLDWKPDGSLLATGTWDGFLELWNMDGNPTSVRKVQPREVRILAVKWNKTENLILSALGDNTTVIWDANSGRLEEFAFHESHIFDIAWCSPDTFASCSRDIHVCKRGCHESPIKTFTEHTADVNDIEFDKEGTRLASCSDDTTIKIWDMNQDTCVLTLQGHSRKVNRVQWNLTEPDILASGSFDRTIKLWNVKQGACIHTFTAYKGEIIDLAFSPDGKYLASGSMDKRICIWNIETKECVYNFHYAHSVLQVCWNHEGDKIAARTAAGLVHVLYFQK